MSISSVQSAQNVYTENLSQLKSTQADESPNIDPKDAFTFKISDTAKMLFEKFDLHPSQEYVYPEWSQKWLSDLNLMNFDGRMESITHQIERFNSFDQETKVELKEYHHSIQKHINEELKNHGIENKENYYDKFIQDDKLSEEVHQSVIKRIADDPRVMELMESFGLSLY